MSKHEELIQRLCDLSNLDESIDCDLMKEAAQALEAQAREIEWLRKDAERYRWLRQDHFIEGVGMALGVCTEDVSLKHECSHQPICGDALDAAVDAAIDAAKGEPHG